MIELKEQEAKDVLLALKLGLISFTRDEGLKGMSQQELDSYLNKYYPTKELLFSILRGKEIMEKKVTEEFCKSKEPVNDRFEILDL